jgi:hypothetical protein
MGLDLATGSRTHLHGLGQVHMLDFHRIHFNPPRVGFRIENGLKLHVDLVACGQQFIQLGLPQDISQHRLCLLVRGPVEIFHIDHGFFRIQDTEEDDRVNVQRHIILGDDVGPEKATGRF